MMSNIATTIEQSKHLLELGLGIKSADMCLCKTAQDTWFLCAGTPGEYDAHTVPAWSLSALLDVMPKPDLYRETADLWVCVAFFKEGSIRGFGETAIDAACDNITKMFGRGYLKKKGGEDENN